MNERMLEKITIVGFKGYRRCWALVRDHFERVTACKEQAFEGPTRWDLTGQREEEKDREVPSLPGPDDEAFGLQVLHASAHLNVKWICTLNQLDIAC